MIFYCFFLWSLENQTACFKTLGAQGWGPGAQSDSFLGNYRYIFLLFCSLWTFKISYWIIHHYLKWRLWFFYTNILTQILQNQNRMDGVLWLGKKGVLWVAVTCTLEFFQGVFSYRKYFDAYSSDHQTKNFD